MATIPREALEYLTEQINGASTAAQAQAMRVLERVDWSDVADARQLVVEAVQMVLANATELAAQASADFYDASRELCVGEPMGAVAASGYEPDATDGAIRSFVRFVVDDGNVEQFNDQVLQRIDYEVKLSAANSTLENGRRDPRKPKFARVPTGAETCQFCLMLASRGFVYRTESTASMGHVHSDCDCRICAGWDGDTVDGYDPDAYYRQWRGNIDQRARERAEKNGTSYEEERRKIMDGYARSARASRNGKAEA